MSSFTEEELAAAAWRRNLKLAEQLSREGERGRGPRRTDEWKGVGRRDCYGYEKASQSRWAEQGRGRTKKSRRRAYSDEEKGKVDEFGRMMTRRDDDKKSKTTNDSVDSSHCRYSERGRSCSRSRSNSEEDRRRRSRSRERREHHRSRSRSQERVRNERYVSSL